MSSKRSNDVNKTRITTHYRWRYSQSRTQAFLPPQVRRRYSQRGPVMLRCCSATLFSRAVYTVNGTVQIALHVWELFRQRHCCDFICPIVFLPRLIHLIFEIVLMWESVNVLCMWLIYMLTQPRLHIAGKLAFHAPLKCTGMGTINVYFQVLLIMNPSPLNMQNFIS